MALGVVLIMTVKPAAAIAVAWVAIGAVLGGAAGLAMRQARPA
jgi:hypothetical protein